MAVKNPRKAEIIKEFGESEGDTGSTQLQVAVLTDRIKHLTTHLQKFKKDHATRRGLLRLVGRRAALLRYYHRRHPAKYRDLIQTLGIRR